MKWWQLILLGVGIALAVLASYRIGLYCGRISPVEHPIIKVDTLYLHDTITITKPRYVARRQIDTLFLPADTLRIRDTLWMVLPREQVMWEDSLARVYASGVMPQVDSVTHFTQERIIYIDRTAPAPKFGVGVSVGPAIGYMITPKGWQPGAGISAQIGVYYRF